ncbi:MAG: hypothetical protein ACC707_02635 [Thiohalomonadales bacterium]
MKLRNLFSPKYGDDYLLFSLLAGVVLLSACSDPKLAEETSANFVITVDKSIIDNESRCFFDDGRLDASAYVYCGTSTLANNCSGKPGPQQKVKLSQDENLDYVSTVDISNSGTFSIAIVCDVGENQENPIDTLKFLRHETYIVRIKDTAGLIASYNKPASHLAHRESSSSNFGLVCDDCHTVNESNTFLYTKIDHSVLIETCRDCHSAGGIGDAPSSTHLTYTPDDRSCNDCHVDYLWLPVPLQDHDSLPSGDCTSSFDCICKSCHLSQKMPSTAHDTTTAECETCHIPTNWNLVN